MTTTRPEYVRVHVADLRIGDVLRAYEPEAVSSIDPDPSRDGVAFVGLRAPHGHTAGGTRLFELDTVTIRAREATR
jgi:hypothetical protein